jgi:hypothetical protein
MAMPRSHPGRAPIGVRLLRFNRRADRLAGTEGYDPKPRGRYSITSSLRTSTADAMDWAGSVSALDDQTAPWNVVLKQ